MEGRFLMDSDYLGILTEEALEQLTRGDVGRLLEAEESAEQSVLEYLTENYEIEKVLEVGKRLLPFSSDITYPAGAHFKYNGKVCKAIRTINGSKAPADREYWIDVSEVVVRHEEIEAIPFYTQTGSYTPSQRVRFSSRIYECLEYNGADYNDIRIPGVCAWARLNDVKPWEANEECRLWDVREYEGHFYTLMEYPSTEDLIDPHFIVHPIEDYERPVPEEPEEGEKDPDEDDGIEEGDGAPDDSFGGNAADDAQEAKGWALNPYDSECWGMIDDYHKDCSEYTLEPNEYVVYNGDVYYPIMNPNPEEPKLGYNMVLSDPRNANIKKHLLRLAVYELYKLITPTNMSQVRIVDYETSITWLRDAGRLKITPGIPRKLDRDHKPVTDFAIATFARHYDPYKNPWHI